MSRTIKKVFLSICVAAMSLSLSFSLSSCGKKNNGGDATSTPSPITSTPTSTHTHTYSNSWSYDSEYHWHDATCEHTSLTSGKTAHTFNGDTCSICGYKKETSIVKYTITFDANGGTFENNLETYSVEVIEGNLLSSPSEPSRDGYIFTSWYKDSELNEIYDFNDQVTKAFSLYAGWEQEIVDRNVTFVLNYENSTDVVESTVDGLVTYVPQRTGYVFNGWWLSDGKTPDGDYILSSKWDTSEIVTVDDLVLYAEWVDASTVSSQLHAPSVSIDSGVFTWDSIENAVKYDIRVYAAGSNVELTSESITSASWTFPSNYEFGYYLVKIRAIGDGINTVNSSYVSKNYAHHILSEVSKINFDITTSVLTWSSVKNATAYELYINNNLVETSTYCTFNMSSYNAGEYTIKIVATRKDYQSSSATKIIEKKRLRTPNVSVFFDSKAEKYILVWDRVDKADTYTLKFKDTEIKVLDETSYTFDNTAEFWKDAYTISFTMTAFDSNADYLISTATKEMTIDKVYTYNIEANHENVGNITITGAAYTYQSFDVEFVYNNDSPNVTEKVTVTKGLAYPEIPAKKGYIFTGWYSDSSCTKLYDFTSEVTCNFKLYAGWTKIPTEEYSGGRCLVSTLNNYFRITNRDSTNPNYMYYIALTKGKYNIIYSHDSTYNCGVYFRLKNLNSGKVYISDEYLNRKDFSYNIYIELEVGDIIQVCNYNKSKSDTSAFNFNIEGGKFPNSGGLASKDMYYIKGTESTISNESTIYSNLDTTLTLSAKTTDSRYEFDGWYNGDELLSKDSTYTIQTNEDIFKYTAKWKYVTLTLNYVVDGEIVDTESYTLDKHITEFKEFPEYTNFIGWFVDPKFSCNSSNCVSTVDLVADGVNTYVYGGTYVGTEGLRFNYSSKYKVYVVTDYYGSATEVVVPSMFNNIPVGRLNSLSNSTSIFSNKQIESISLPDTLTYIDDYALAYCKKLTTVTIPNSVTITGNSVLKGCDNLVSVTLSSKISFQQLVLENFAFVFPKSLKTVTISEGSTELDNKYFMGCDLEYINLPESLERIRSYVFQNCKYLKQITIPSNVWYYDSNGLFTGCDRLESLSLPYIDAATSSYYPTLSYLFGNKGKVDSYKDNANYVPGSLETVTITGVNETKTLEKRYFYGLTRILKVVLPSEITSIGDEAFYNCSGMLNITLPTNLESICNAAFSGCKSIKQIDLPESLVTINDYAFYNCENISTIKIPNTITTIGKQAFWDCYGLVEINNESSLIIEIGSSNNGYLGYYAKNIYTPTDGQSKITIDEAGFVIFKDKDQEILIDYVGNDQNVVVPSTVTSIRQGVFWEHDIVSISLPCVSGGYFGFVFGASDHIFNRFFVPESLETVLIETDYKILGYCFNGCQNIKEITIKDTSSSGSIFVLSNAFKGCDSLEKLSLPYIETLSQLFGYQVAPPISLKTVIINSDSIELAENAFANCDYVENIILPDTIISLYSNSFDGCNASIIKEYNNGLYIGNDKNPYYAFVKPINRDVQDIIINESTIVISNSAFENCVIIKDITLSDSITTIGEKAFSGCTNLMEISIPRNVKKIMDLTFYNCKELTEVVLPEGIIEISFGAFWNCTSLERITIPNSVSIIKSNAFYNCTALASIEFGGTVKQWNNINKEKDWNYNTGKYTITCTDGTIAKS